MVIICAAALGAILSLLGAAAYLRDVRARVTVPHRGSWLVWATVAVVAAAAQGAHGLTWTLVVLVAEAIANASILFLAVRHGVGGVSVGNAVLIGLATLGVLAWIGAGDPVLASAGAVLADGAGLVATNAKAWHLPHTETTSTYALAGATGLTAVVCLPSWGMTVLLFPVYYCLANSGTALLIVIRRRWHPQPARLALPAGLTPLPAVRQGSHRRAPLRIGRHARWRA